MLKQSINYIMISKDRCYKIVGIIRMFFFTICFCNILEYDVFILLEKKGNGIIIFLKVFTVIYIIRTLNGVF